MLQIIDQRCARIGNLEELHRLQLLLDMVGRRSKKLRHIAGEVQNWAAKTLLRQGRQKLAAMHLQAHRVSAKSGERKVRHPRTLALNQIARVLVRQRRFLNA